MKKQNLTEGIVDAIYKMLSLGKYRNVQKNFKDNPEVKIAVKKAELARKDLIKAIEKSAKSHGHTPYSPATSKLIKKYGR